MPIEDELSYTFGMDKETIDQELAKHSTSGSEWGEIDDYEPASEERTFQAKNWRGDILNSLKKMENEFPPETFVLIQREVVEKDYLYSIQAYSRRKSV